MNEYFARRLANAVDSGKPICPNCGKELDQIIRAADHVIVLDIFVKWNEKLGKFDKIIKRDRTDLGETYFEIRCPHCNRIITDEEFKDLITFLEEMLKNNFGKEIEIANALKNNNVHYCPYCGKELKIIICFISRCEREESLLIWNGREYLQNTLKMNDVELEIVYQCPFCRELIDLLED